MFPGPTATTKHYFVVESAWLTVFRQAMQLALVVGLRCYRTVANVGVHRRPRRMSLEAMFLKTIGMQTLHWPA